MPASGPLFLCITFTILPPVLLKRLLKTEKIMCGFSVGIMWPGTLSISSKKIPTGGTAMFALLAMAGDLGGSIGPSTVGMISQKAGDNLQYGLFFGGIFPVVLVIFLIILKFMKKEK